jgi:hypothetical protein
VGNIGKKPALGKMQDPIGKTKITKAKMRSEGVTGVR